MKVFLRVLLLKLMRASLEKLSMEEIDLWTDSGYLEVLKEERINAFLKLSIKGTKILCFLSFETGCYLHLL